MQHTPTGFLTATPLPYAETLFGTRALATLHDVTAALNAPVACMHQVHGATLTYATEALQYPACDGIFTDIPNLWLAVKTADCTPCLISSPKAVAAVHLGWRSAQAGLLATTLTTLMHDFKQAPDDISLHFGPALSQPHFEVEDTFPALFEVANEAPFFTPSVRPGHVMMNLGAILTHSARRLGVPLPNIHLSGHCTFTQAETFHSYRRDKADAGRQFSLIRRI